MHNFLHKNSHFVVFMQILKDYFLNFNKKKINKKCFDFENLYDILTLKIADTHCFPPQQSLKI